MSANKKAIAGSYIKTLAEYLETYQLGDISTLLRQLNIDPKHLSSPTHFLTLEQYKRFMETVLKEVNYNDMMQTLLDQHHITQHGMVGLLSLCSLNVKQALNMVRRFSRLQSNLVSIDLIELPSHASVRVTPSCDLGPAERFTIEMTLAVIHQSKAELQNKKSNHHQIDLIYPAFDTEPTYATVNYNQSYNQLIFPTEDLNVKLISANPLSHRHLEQQCESYLIETVSEHEDIHKIKAELRQCGGPFPTLSDMSQNLHRSTRTLTRRLSDENLTYQYLLDQERIRRAKQLVLHTHMTITEIASLLYFSDNAHFSKVFKKHTGLPPLKYRKQHSNR